MKLNYNQMQGLLNALGTVNIKGFKVNYAILRNSEKLERELARFRKLVKQSATEEIILIENTDSSVRSEDMEAQYKAWQEDMNRLALEEIEMDFHKIKADLLPEDIDTETMRPIMFMVETEEEEKPEPITPPEGPDVK